LVLNMNVKVNGGSKAECGKRKGVVGG
jgi:hypothetical protein